MDRQTLCPSAGGRTEGWNPPLLCKEGVWSLSSGWALLFL